MNENFGMDDDLTTYTDAMLQEALRRATGAQEVAERQLSEAAEFKSNTSMRDNLAVTVQTLASHISRIKAEIARRRAPPR